MAKKLAEIFKKYGITTKESIALFLATCAHESDYGRLILEEGTQAYFDNMDKYGYNDRGVGYIQLTMRDVHLKFLKDMGDSYNGQNTAQHIADNYDPWEVSAYVWLGMRTENGNKNRQDLNDYSSQYGAGENIFLVTQYFINWWPSPSSPEYKTIDADLSSVRKGGAYQIKDSRLYVNGRNYRLPEGWASRIKAYNNIMDNYYNK